jgi:hypothetical protein
MKPGGEYYDCSRCGSSCREDNLDVHEQYHERFEGIVRQVATFLTEIVQSMGGQMSPEGYEAMGLGVPINTERTDDARSTRSSVRSEATYSEARQDERLRPREQESAKDEEVEDS